MISTITYNGLRLRLVRVLINKTYKMNKEKFKVKIEKIVDDYSNCSLIDVNAISEEAYELALTLTDVVGHSEQLRFLIDKFQTPKGNYLIKLLMAEKERKDKKP